MTVAWSRTWLSKTTRSCSKSIKSSRHKYMNCSPFIRLEYLKSCDITAGQASLTRLATSLILRPGVIGCEHQLRRNTRCSAYLTCPTHCLTACHQYATMLSLFLLLSLYMLLVTSEWTNPKDALINPRGQKVCLQQCGTSELKCPEAFVCHLYSHDPVLKLMFQ
ncbi:uncharacterized protein K460DRAFT_39598 [Cucurbitaria berberidis CBS 394.84]|uniref:Uncharacterized protein n=1 Tax=Cucurbitaria berberidis CBS 394.84 TaxID=1168544 RepID=A0A9P4GTY5_9PLEO|nr:uncharacterized protein K460DRAFT_39598 [Cucurbitaria berberidis CBS 394.84]KAF1851700.1 hypothetical protein K460DRAFT_39598 [Cucurbitaria berberidis CBS 394.84]